MFGAHDNPPTVIIIFFFFFFENETGRTMYIILEAVLFSKTKD